MTAPDLTLVDLSLAAGLVLLNALLSLLLSLGLARTIIVAGIRAIVQLILVGFVLGYVFTTAMPPVVFCVAMVMALAATYEVGTRQDVKLRGLWGYGIGGGALAMSTAAVAAYALLTHIRPQPWYDPRYLIPLVGILLGSVMSGVSIGMSNLTSTIVRERVVIESRLALGASRFEALHPFIRSAIRAGLIPSLNQMVAAGLITLPGMMSGQILAGMDPEAAARYQILILFLLAGASGLGVVGAVFATARRLTDDRHRLRLDRLR